MRRRISRLSVKEVVNKKEAGYYCDGGGLYLQVSDSGSIVDLPLYLERQESAHGAGPIPYRIPC